MKKKVILRCNFIVIGVYLVLTIVFNIVYMRYGNKKDMYYDRGIKVVPEADYIVVPGAQILSSYPDLYLQHRLDYAYMLYKEQKASKIIISGGYDDKVGKHETQIMMDYLLRLNVRIEDIIIDTQGNSTYETLKRIKDYIGDKSIIFVTQEIYSYRALYISKKLNLDTIVFCSDPMMYCTNMIKSMIRENLAQIKAIINCKFIPQHTVSLKKVPFYLKDGE